MERPDATVLLVAKSRSVLSVGSLHRKGSVGLTSNMVRGSGKAHPPWWRGVTVQYNLEEQ